MTHIVGMSDKNADISRQSKKTHAEVLTRSALGAFFTPDQMPAAGLTRDQIPALMRAGAVERLGRGLYRVAESEPSEYYSLALACARVPRSVVCLLSALRVHGIGTQSPAAVWLAIPHKARAPKVPELQLRLVRFSAKAWTFGVKDVAFEGVPARITSPARTVVDCFRFRRLVGAEVALEALRDGLAQRKFTVADVARVEATLPSRRLRAALELESV